MKRSRTPLTVLLILALLLLMLPAVFSCKEREKDNGHAHVFGEWTVTKQPTCNKSGSKVRVCECGKRETQSIPPEHSGEWDILSEPTCTAGGFRYRKCSLCGAEEREALDPLGHEGEWQQTLAPTCDESGRRSRVCTRCGKTQNENVAPLGHQCGDWSVVKEPTCQRGLKERVCAVCGVREYEEIPADYSLHDVDAEGVCTLCGEKAASSGFQFELIDKFSLAVTSYKGEDAEVVVPSYYYGANVTCIRASAFRDNKAITSVVIPTSVTDIEEGTFSGCSSLVSLTLPFVGSHYELPDEEKEEVAQQDLEQKPLAKHSFGIIFGKRPFDDSVEVMQNYVGEEGLRLAGIYHLPASLRSVTVTGGEIVDGAFSGCNMLTSITLPSHANEIGAYVFAGCDGLESLSLPASVSKVAPEAFKNCSSLQSFTFEAGSQLRTIGFGAFFGCAALVSLAIPSTVRSVGTSAFASCDALTSLDFAEGSVLTTVGAAAFSGCALLEKLDFPQTLGTIGGEALRDCAALSSLSFAGSKEEWAAVTKGKDWNPKGLSVTCEDGVAEE